MELALAGCVAWLGRRAIGGFDIRGPFLLISPVLAGGLGFLLFSVCGNPRSNGVPKAKDIEFLRCTAEEFGLGPITVGQRQVGPNLHLFVALDDGTEILLPKDWSTFSGDARRFSAVRSILSGRKSVARATLERLPMCGAEVVGMTLAGINLWLILACHAVFAVWIVVRAGSALERKQWLLDRRALKQTRDLKGAIAFAREDKDVSVPNRSREQRIALLKLEAFRLGIASSRG
jgi:hypothetical protein